MKHAIFTAVCIFIAASPAAAQQIPPANTLQELQKRVEKLEKGADALKATDRAKFAGSPIFRDPDGNFTFGFSGRVQADAALFDADEGGLDLNSGTAFRRARLGLNGKMYDAWGWKIEGDLAEGDSVTLTDAYVQYSGIKDLALTMGQRKSFYTLEDLTSSRFITFLERPLFVNAFSTGAGRKIGLSALYTPGDWTIGGGLFGENATVDRNTADPDESWGPNLRVTYAPLNDKGSVVHVGASSYYRLDPAEGRVRFRDRPEVRVDGTRLVDTGDIRGVESYGFGGIEAATVVGPFWAQAEYGRTFVARAGDEDASFDGYYAAAGYFLTGESRPYKKGAFARVEPQHNFALDGGGFGAWEVAGRYSVVDLNDGTVRGGKETNITLGLNWYITPYTRMMLDWVRFAADDSPAAVAGDDVVGNAYALRVQVDW